MRRLYMYIVDLIVGSVMGSVVAVFTFPFNLITFAFFIGMACLNYAKYKALSQLIIKLTVAATILFTAAIAPIKTTQTILRSSIRFDAQKMTLEQLDIYLNTPIVRSRLPIRIRLAFAVDDKDTVVTLPESTTSVAGFIEIIQTQTKLRSMFKSCGNGWTILWGDDCSFGLLLIDGELLAEHPRKRYETK